MWLGSSYNLQQPHVLASRPQWLVLPIRDVGIQIGRKVVDRVGTLPGERLALCVERPLKPTPNQVNPCY